MGRILIALVVTAHILGAADWREIRSGPYLVFSDDSDDSDDAARDAVNHLEQFRHALGQAFGRAELESVWPITVVVQKNAAPSFAFGRDGWYATWPARSVPPPEFFKQLGQQFLNDNLKGRMPQGFEAALVAAYSTLAVDGIRLTFGAPPAPPDRTLQWAMIHMLTTNPDTSGRMRVLLSNLANGADADASFRNAFQKPQSELEAQARTYLAAGNFGTARVNSRPLDTRKLTIREALPSRLRALPGDLLLAQGKAKEAAAAYQKGLNERPSAILQEGYGLSLLELNDKAAAKTALIAAVSDAEARPARTYLELARLDPQFMPAAPVRKPAAAKQASTAAPKPASKKPSREEEEAPLTAVTQVDAGTLRIGAPKVEKPQPEPEPEEAAPAEPEKQRSLVERAAEANPKWADPYIYGAELEPGPIRRAALLAKACELLPRRVDLWQRLAEAQTEAKQYEDATKSWLAAERAASSPEERDRIIAARRESDAARLDAAAAARKRELDEKAAEVERLRLENEARIRAAEAKANAELGEYKGKVEQWWDGPKTEAVTGTLTRIDCAKGAATLHLRTASGDTVRFAVPDVGKLALIGGTTPTIACGVQNPPRAAKVEHLPATSKTATPVAVIVEFR